MWVFGHLEDLQESLGNSVNLAGARKPWLVGWDVGLTALEKNPTGILEEMKAEAHSALNTQSLRTTFHGYSPHTSSLGL